MKAVLVIVAVVFGMALVAPILVQAADYSKMSTDQLYQMKKSGSVPLQEEQNLNSEWMKRVVNMTPEERQKYQVRYSDEEIQKMRMERQTPR